MEIGKKLQLNIDEGKQQLLMAQPFYAYGLSGFDLFRIVQR